jgi:hypothetical protein
MRRVPYFLTMRDAAGLQNEIRYLNATGVKDI